jgi:hypothetical protein
MGCGKTLNQRKNRKDGMEELETKVARKSIQREVIERLKKRSHITEGKTCLSIKIVLSSR